MQITGLTQYHAEHDMDGSFDPTWIPGFPQGTHEAAVFEVETDAGITGVAAGPSFGGGLDYSAPLGAFLGGEDPHNIEGILRKLDSVTLAGPSPWHIEMALWDIVGKDAGKPVHELLGASAEPIPVYASTGQVMDADERIDYVAERVDAGVEAVKLRVTEVDHIDIVREVREAFPDLTLMVDANKGWAIRVVEDEVEWSYKDALEFARGLEAVGNVAWLEEPLPRDDYRGYARLREATDVPIAGGEFNHGPAPFREFIRHDALDVIQADAALATGVKRATEIAAAARRNGIEFVPHTWTNGAGMAANLHVMAVAESAWCEYPMEPPWTPEVVSFFLEETFEHEDGYIEPPTDPGLGITLDHDELEEL